MDAQHSSIEELQVVSSPLPRDDSKAWNQVDEPRIRTQVSG